MSKLYLVGTPIGNLSDMTLRGINTLKEVDVIACEDTRHSMGLLNYYDIKKPLISCHKFNEKESIDKISKLLQEEKNVALITDAGMPAISDPGAILVEGIRNLGFNIEVVPGPTALTSAVSLCGLKQPIFTFIGFLPQKKKDRELLISNFKNVPSNLVIYSSPYDLNKDLEFLYKHLGDRNVFVIKEITKIHESVIKFQLKDANIENPKGEFVIIVEPPVNETKDLNNDISIQDQVKNLMDNGVDKKEAIKKVAKQNNLTKDDVYKEVICLK